MVTQVYSRVEVAERMTAEAFFRDAPETHKAELIDGVLNMPSPASDIHEKLFAFLFTLLRMYAEDHMLGHVRGSRTAVGIAPSQVYEPDILFVPRKRQDIIQEKGVLGAPDLVIEILSASTAANDRGPKFRGYESAGVRELWLIDPYGPAGTEFYQLQSNMFAPLTPDSTGRVRSQTLAGFWIDVAWLWPAAEFIAVREALATISS